MYEIEDYSTITYKVVEEANVGTALVEAFAAGNDIKLTQNVTVSEPLVATGRGQSLDLNGKTINNTTEIWNEAEDKWSLISVQGGSLTISGEGTLSARSGDCYAIDVRGGASLTIESGTYVGNISAVYVETGTAQINGGEFSIQQTSTIGGQNGYGYVLNCLDANYAAKTAAITVKGGKFQNFDPKANPEGTNTSYMAVNYTTNKDGYFWVAGYDPLVTESDLEKLFGPTTASGSISSLKLKDSFSKGDKTLTLDQSKKSAVLDLNGMTLQVAAIVLNGSLTVNNGKLIANSIEINDGGNLTLNNVTDFDYSKVKINSANVEFETTAKSQQELEQAAAKATNITLEKGEYIVPQTAKGKTMTFVGTGNPEDVKVAVTKVGTGGENCDYGLDGSNVTFEGITITTNSSTYIGYARCNGTYKNCIINGTYTLYGDSIFEGCEFNVTGDVYNIWTWGAPTAKFINCTFNSDGKSLLLYGTANTKLTVEKCIFNDKGGLNDLKAAIEIGNDYNMSYELIVTDTKVNGFEINDKGINTGTTLWANKNSMPKDKLNVIVDGVDVY